ncbi:uncharacterized protein LOC121858276 [Homarus americanus]|uniref:uncharacterized protein LOC121858276 n=1 Tax=Homarus americanus TaxID=6706 RepID=UPI001C436A9C|nr:uncharacterized protein LOC121858276 [Homarus americanus]
MENVCCRCFCSTRGGCFVVAVGRLCVDIIDILFMYQWRFPETLLYVFIKSVCAVDIALCILLIIGATFENRRLVISWVWFALVVLVMQIVLSAILIVENRTYIPRGLFWVLLCTAANVYMILVVSSYGFLMGVEERKWQQLNEWVEAVGKRRGHRDIALGCEEGALDTGSTQEPVRLNVFQNVQEMVEHVIL